MRTYQSPDNPVTGFNLKRPYCLLRILRHRWGELDRFHLPNSFEGGRVVVASYPQNNHTHHNRRILSCCTFRNSSSSSLSLRYDQFYQKDRFWSGDCCTCHRRTLRSCVSIKLLVLNIRGPIFFYLVHRVYFKQSAHGWKMLWVFKWHSFSTLRFDLL